MPGPSSMRELTPIENAAWHFLTPISDALSTVEAQMLGTVANVGIMVMAPELETGRAILSIGDLSLEEQAIVKQIWAKQKPACALPERQRLRLADYYAKVGERSAGSGQGAFNKARAAYLRGQGPHPGRTVDEFNSVDKLR